MTDERGQTIELLDRADRATAEAFRLASESDIWIERSLAVLHDYKIRADKTLTLLSRSLALLQRAQRQQRANDTGASDYPPPHD